MNKTDIEHIKCERADAIDIILCDFLSKSLGATVESRAVGAFNVTEWHVFRFKTKDDVKISVTVSFRDQTVRGVKIGASVGPHYICGSFIERNNKERHENFAKRIPNALSGFISDFKIVSPDLIDKAKKYSKLNSDTNTALNSLPEKYLKIFNHVPNLLEGNDLVHFCEAMQILAENCKKEN